MYIYLTLLLPVITCLILYFKFKKETLWWEFFLPFIATVIMIFTVKGIGESMQLSDTEYLNDIIVDARFYEKWDEEVPCTHSYDCNCSKDSKGNETCSTCYYHSYDVDTHPKHWTALTQAGRELDITENEYNRLVNEFGNKSFVDMHRDYHSIDGDMYKSIWQKDPKHLQCVVFEHSYVNKVQISNSVFNFPNVDTADIKRYSLFEYPTITSNYKQQHILGTYNLEAERNMEILNGLYGSRYQLKAFILVFKDKPKMAGEMQEWYWKGGNKNEFVLCIGVDKQNNITWCYPFSWTESKTPCIEIRNFVATQKNLNLVNVTNQMFTSLKGFKRKHFKDFDYLDIEPTTGQMVWTFILSLLFNVGTALFVIMNQAKERD